MGTSMEHHRGKRSEFKQYPAFVILAGALTMLACNGQPTLSSRTTSSINRGSILPPCQAGCEPYTNDPNPDSIGVWFDTTVFSPTYCFDGVTEEDDDHDGVGDQCEWALAKRFAPIMVFDSGDEVGREPYWAARRVGSDSSMEILYMPAYYVDLGCSSVPLCGELDDGHLGDSEAIGITISWDPHSAHWILVEAALSSHDTYRTLSAGGNRYPTTLEYPTELGGPFRVHVAYGKHANYETRTACNGGSDYCNNGGSGGDTLYVPLNRNVGSSGYKLADCVYSVGIPDDDYEECFWSGSDFAGWQGHQAGYSYATAYEARLEDFGFIY